jgi:hypothetical protein
MSFRSGKDTKALVSTYDLSPYLNEITSGLTIDTAETTTFGSLAKTYVTGLNDGAISFGGMFDGEANAIVAIFEDIIENDRTPVITIGYDGGLAVGRSAALAVAKQTTYEITAPVSDVVSLTGEFQVTSGIRQGVVLAAQEAITSTTDGTSVDNSASTSIGATANLHVTANTRSSATTIKVQHSADNSTWADLITFTSVPATTLTSETISSSGTVNRYLRAQTTLAAGSGSITITIAVARRN